jgi:hypothetical protein
VGNRAGVPGQHQDVITRRRQRNIGICNSDDEIMNKIVV